VRGNCDGNSGVEGAKICHLAVALCGSFGDGAAGCSARSEWREVVDLRCC